MISKLVILMAFARTEITSDSEHFRRLSYCLKIIKAAQKINCIQYGFVTTTRALMEIKFVETRIWVHVNNYEPKKKIQSRL